jgi:hypothetical protein
MRRARGITDPSDPPPTAHEVGTAGGAQVTDDYPDPNSFTGEVSWVEIAVDDAAADADHMVTAEERLRVAMARQ